MIDKTTTSTSNKTNKMTTQEPAQARFVVETWSDQRSVRKAIAKELVAEKRSAETWASGAPLPFLRDRWSLRRQGAVGYGAVHERYEKMRARGEIVETEAFCQARKNGPFVR